MKTATRIVLLATTLLSANIAATLAQERDASPPSQTPSPKAPPSPDDRREGSTTAPGAGSTESLSHELSRSGGVIQPPQTGDQSVVQPPANDAGRMPVLPPPGTPGGNSTVKPK